MKLIVSSILVLCSLMSISQEKLGRLHIYFEDLESNEGGVLVLVQDENEKDVSKLVLSINNKSAKVDLYLPQGKYAITAFHDLNGNEILDKNFLGVPTEPYGFSNNERNLLSKPDLESILVTLTDEAQSSFKLEYYP